MNDPLNRDIKYLQGVGPKRAEILNKELGIFTCKDLVYHFPYKYIDKSKFYKIRDIAPDMQYIQLKGKILEWELIGAPRKKRLVAHFTDGESIIELVWFQGHKWVRENYTTGKEYIVFGKPALFNRVFNIVHPEIEDPENQEKQITAPLQGLYPTTEKLKKNYITSKTLAKLQNIFFQSLKTKVHESLPSWFLEKHHLLSRHGALFNIHFPKDWAILKRAGYRLKFEELFTIQLGLLRLKVERGRKFKGFVFKKVGGHFNHFYQQNLSFELTGAQKRVLKEIRRDTASGKQMNRLLQGDVGSGKTLVALMSMLIALDNGYQACLMAPTEILANQHYETLQEFLKGIDISVRLLTGSTRKAERSTIHEELLNGANHILIGTHALIEEVVQFKNLGITVIDEQHRFGVAQRAKLWKKNTLPPHVLVMTATPIPRTLAMTLYGDLDVSVIDEMPPGRKRVKTYHNYDSKRLPMFGFLKKQIKNGRQVYIVYPLIKESEKMDYKDLEDGVESIQRAFPPPEYAISVVHGQMKAEEKEISMKLFQTGKTQIMVATTVIEVGVDIPNATIMVIESAERFGLSQLHQLRGRVGRGAEQSYCILMTSYKLTKEAKQRITTMVSSNDGFEIAEVDMKLRGPGDLEGTQQSGIPFDLKIANLGKDQQILQYACDIAENILQEDPALTQPENEKFRELIEKEKTPGIEWGYIS